MNCPKCGESPTQRGDPELGDLRLTPEGRITGVASINTDCPECGVSQATLGVEIEVQVPPEHRQADHDLQIDFAVIKGSQTMGFPVEVRCSCGGMRVKGVLMLRRAN